MENNSMSQPSARRSALLSLGLLLAISCYGQEDKPNSIASLAQFQMRPVVDRDDYATCSVCETHHLIGRAETTEVKVDKQMSLPIPIRDTTVIMLEVDQGSTGVVWKAEIALNDELERKMRQFVASAPEAEYFVVSQGNQALALIPTPVVGNVIIIGDFDTQRSLEQVLELSGLQSHQIRTNSGEYLEASREAIRAADDVLKRHESERPLFDGIEHALKEGDMDQAERLLEELRRE